MPDTGYCISILLYLSLAYREGILKRYRGVVGKSDNGKPLADGLFDIFFRVIGTVAESRVSMEVEWQLRITDYELIFSALCGDYFINFICTTEKNINGN